MPPKLSINIQNTTCRTGSTLSGSVELQHRHATDVLTLQISFVGLCKLSVSNGDNGYRQTVALRGYPQRLFEGHATLQPGHRWSFELTIPSFYTLPRPHPKDRLPFNAGSRVQPLHLEEESTAIYNEDEIQRFPPPVPSADMSSPARISYGLEATMVVQRRMLKPKQVTAWKALDFVVSRESDDPAPQTFSLTASPEERSELQPQGSQSDPLCFHHVRRSRNPNLSLEVQYPTVGIPGQEMRLILGVKDEGAIRHKELPVFLLRSLDIKLIANTHARINWIDNTRPRHLYIGKNSHLKKPLQRQLKIRDVMPLKLPPDVVPTFATRQVSRKYYFKLKVVLEYPAHKKKVKLSFHTGQMIVLPPDHVVKEAAETALDHQHDRKRPAVRPHLSGLSSTF